MINSFDGIILIVKDIKKQKDFYEKILGLPLESDYGTAVFFKLGNKKIGLFSQEHHLEGLKSLEGAKKGISHVEFGVTSKDFKKISKLLTEKGFHAYGDTYKDADGNLFYINIDGDINY